jgi:hypothetical protein
MMSRILELASTIGRILLSTDSSYGSIITLRRHKSPESITICRKKDVPCFPGGFLHLHVFSMGLIPGTRGVQLLSSTWACDDSHSRNIRESWSGFAGTVFPFRDKEVLRRATLRSSKCSYVEDCVGALLNDG